MTFHREYFHRTKYSTRHPLLSAKKVGKEEFQKLAATAADFAVAKAKSIFDAASTKGIVRGDLNAGDIFFDDDVSEVFTLIDWGSASKRASVGYFTTLSSLY